MSTQLERFAECAGHWEGQFSTFAPTPGRHEQPIEAKAHVIVVEPQPDGSVRQTNRYPGAPDMVSEVVGDAAGLSMYFLKDGSRAPGFPGWSEGVRFFPGGGTCTGMATIRLGAPFLAEQGMIDGNSRTRTVYQYGPDGTLARFTTIRETRNAPWQDEDPQPLSPARLAGAWQGTLRRFQRSSGDETLADGALAIEPAGDDLVIRLERPVAAERRVSSAVLFWLPGGIFAACPTRLGEALGSRTIIFLHGWLAAPDRLHIMAREYDSDGHWREVIVWSLAR